MPSILLINENKIVSRLLQLSSEKNGYNLEEVTALDSSGDSYDVIFVDSDKYSDALMGQIESKLNYEQLGYIGAKQETAPEGFDLVIEKPFLPTDFVDMIKEQVIAKKATMAIADMDSHEELNSFDMDDETDMLLADEELDLDDLDNINEGVEQLLVNDDEASEISLDDLDAADDIDLSLDPTLVMTTGVAASMAMAESTPEDLADIVNDIDLMEEDPVGVLDESFELETDDESLSDESPELEIGDESLLDEPLELETDDENLLDESFELETDDENLDDPLTLEIDEVEEDSLEEDSLDLEELSLDDDEASEESIDELVATEDTVELETMEINEVPEVIEEVENIEEEISTLDDIDDLSEVDLQHALGEEVIEEVISDEIVSDGEETLVESNDVEQWIRDAVQKAITPEMIKEALEGMDISVTLSFNSKKEGTNLS